jgi:hypothetical protein
MGIAAVIYRQPLFAFDDFRIGDGHRLADPGGEVSLSEINVPLGFPTT